MPVFEISTENYSIIGATELAIKSLFLAHHMGLKEGVDISRPKYPKEARGMYGWEPEESMDLEIKIVH